MMPRRIDRMNTATWKEIRDILDSQGKILDRLTCSLEKDKNGSTIVHFCDGMCDSNVFDCLDGVRK